MSRVVQVIGTGLGRSMPDPESLELVRGAGVLAGGERQLDLFPDFTGRKIVLKSNLAEWLDQVAQAAEN